MVKSYFETESGVLQLRPTIQLQGGGVVPRQAHNLETRMQFPPLLPEAEVAGGSSGDSPPIALPRRDLPPASHRSDTLEELPLELEELRPLAGFLAFVTFVWILVIGWAVFG